jgi:tRNA threonylcarbamoyl adenosine modification protein (Sua5/YciO/YrdC/YwlC family)
MVEAGEVAAAVAAVRAGRPVLLPADGVYGLCASAFKEAPVRRLYDLKGRGSTQPTAMIASSVEMLLECVPELRGRAAVIRALLPGPYTLVLPNPARRYPWLNGESPETIGVRVVELPRTAQYVLDAVGAVAATSANDPGEPPAASLGAVPQRIRDGCGAEIDAGTLSGEPSTVLDLTGDEPRVLRAGAGPVDDALAKLG